MGLIILGLLFLWNSNKEGFDTSLVDILPIQISVDNTEIAVPNYIHGNNGNTFNFQGGIEVNQADTLEIGKGKPKEESAGKIGYQTWSDGLDIVGAGPSIGSRNVHIYDNLAVGQNSNITNNLSVGQAMSGSNTTTNNMTVNSNATTNSVVTAKRMFIYGDLHLDGKLTIGNEFHIINEPLNLMFQGSDPKNYVLLNSMGDLTLSKINKLNTLHMEMEFLDVLL